MKQKLLRLFIADDSKVLRSRLHEILSDVKGVQIVGMSGKSKDVISIIEDLKPDAVILDIRMPGTNGISLLETIKKKKDSPIIIMFTNYPYLQYRKRCMDLGADFFFYKAIEFDKLVKLIKDLVLSREQV